MSTSASDPLVARLRQLPRVYLPVPPDGPFIRVADLDALLASLPPSEAPTTLRFKGHIDADCEVARGVGAYCTCETPEEKAERERERAEIEAEHDDVALPPSEDAQDWQPIETAPKDGTAILAWRDSGVGKMYWRERRGDTGGFWDEWHVKRPSVPTHWMPLPAPPVATTDRST